MLREKTVFGPIHSRRLGSSLGINLLPENGKICTFDCIYCECGWNKDGRDDTVLPTAEKVRHDLEAMLKRLSNEDKPVDSITFSGDGEPTLNPEFPQIIDDTLRLRDQYYPNAKVSVLSNATRVHRPEILAALKRVDNPIMKIDAPTNELAERINHPAPGYDVASVVQALRGFDGNFVLQTMFLKSSDFDSSSPEVLNGWMDIVRTLKPREVMVYTIDRPTPAEKLQKFTVEEMHTLVKPLIDEGFTIQIKG
ncbi:MAG: radical SAM protein [Bacteroidales bacterium]|nr:radical SAM protein [Bacteroidales bacterium]MBR6162060.1 radical SAM protein [Bacteroidales bacterium]